MTKIEAIINPSKLDDVRDALQDAGVSGMTVLPDVRGFGRQKGRVEIFQGSELTVSFIPKVKVEIVTADEHAEKIIAAIQDKTRSGKIGDGKIFITKLSDVVRIRTGEHGSIAI
jgi:nitrogen regulatory protein P-II 1